MTHIKYNIIGIALIAATLSPAMAQKADSTLTQSMTLEREFSPIIVDANKYDRQPDLDQVSVPVTRNTTQADVPPQTVRSQQLGIMPAGQVIVTHIDETEPDGYVDLSAGNWWNTDLKAGIRYGEYTLDLSGFYTKGRLELPFPSSINGESEDWGSRYITGQFKAGYRHEFNDRGILKAHVGASGTNYNLMDYYYSPLHKNKVMHYVENARMHQSWGTINADVAYQTEDLAISLDFEHLGIKRPDINSNQIGVNVRFGLYDYEHWTGEARMRLTESFGINDNYFAIKPEIEFSWLPNRREFRRYYGILGVGSERPALSEVMRELPLTFNFKDYETPFSIFDLTLGYEDNNQGWLRYGASAQFGYTKDEVCAVMRYSPSTYFEHTEDYQKLRFVPGLYNSLINEDCFKFQLEAHADYEYNRYLAAKGELKFHHLSSKAAGWAEPHLQLGLHLISKPGDFTFDLSYQGGWMREMLMYQDGVQPSLEAGSTVKHHYNPDTQEFSSKQDLDPINNLGFRVEWQALPSLKVFAFGQNLLNLDYQLWPGVPAQGITGSLGFHWDF